jgi:hypothetical protein
LAFNIHVNHPQSCLLVFEPRHQSWDQRKS